MELHLKQRTIAEFVGLTVSDPSVAPFTDKLVFAENEEGDDLIWQEPRFNSHYKWLMYAWEKFKELSFEGVVLKRQYRLHLEIIGNAIAFFDIEEAFERLYSGVKWYNENKV